MEHDLKIYPSYFDSVDAGIKTFEFRINDRNYNVGDFLLLREWCGYYSGRSIRVRVTYILPVFDNFVVMAIVKE